MQLRNHAQHQLFALSKGVECTEGLEDNFDFLSPLLAAFPRTSLMPSIPTFKAGSIKWFDCKNGQIISGFPAAATGGVQMHGGALRGFPHENAGQVDQGYVC